jgi:hypothetical protein
VYNAIQTGVIEGFENEAASIQNLKFYEVAPSLTLTQHAITVRPIVMSGKTFRALPEALQAAVLKAGKEAGEFGRELESREDGEKRQEMADAKRPLMILLQNGVVLVLILVFALLFAFYGIEYAKFGSIQNSVMMRANLMVTFISVPIAGVVWTLFAGYRLYEAILTYRKSREDFV